MPMFGPSDIQEVQAATRLHGIQQIVNNLGEKDKFTIMELVPDKAYSSLGYYVSGSEANVDAKLIERLLTYTLPEEAPEVIVSAYATRKEAVKGYFAPITGADKVITYSDSFVYSEKLYLTENMEDWDVITAEEGKSFVEIRKGYYVLASEVGAETGDYTFVPTPTPEEGEDSNEDSSEDDGTVEGDGTSTVVDDSIGEVTGTYQYTPGTGDYVWEDSESGVFEIVGFQKLYYKADVDSNDWFAKNVLELEINADESEGTETTSTMIHNVEVISVTPDELEEKFNSTAGGSVALSDIDMVYISNSSCLALPTDVTYNSYAADLTYTAEAKNDISWETAYNIYEYVVNTKLPVVLDDPIVQSTYAASVLLSANNNVVRLAYLLKAYNTDTTMATYALPATVANETEDAALGLKLNSYLSTIDSSLENRIGKITANVYVNKTGVSLINNAFITKIFTKYANGTESYEGSVTGTSAVVNEISSENFYHNIQNEDYTTEYTFDASGDGNHKIEISQSTFVKYILNYRHRRIEIYKDKITVLDVEPTKYSTLTESKIRTWLGTTVAEEKIKQIEIVQMTSAEFIGKIDDLNEKYDLIYLGSCIGNGSSSGSIRQSSGVTNYNDNNMDGLIYSHVGDSISVPYKMRGLLDTDYKTNGGLNTSSTTTRYSGNDITDTKCKQLKEYVGAGYPVIISSDFYSGSSINPARVDTSSYMYEFMAAYTGSNAVDNVMKDENNQIAVLAELINMPKLNLSMISIPTEYAITYQATDSSKIQSVDYLEKFGSTYVLNYTFEFSNSSEGNSEAYDYQVELFIDTNADGRYAASEKLDALSVRETASQKEIAVNKLKTNVRYTVSRELPEDYVGILPWQLKISRVENSTTETKVRATTNGYTAVKATGIEVRVLQIASSQFRNAMILPDTTYKYHTATEFNNRNVKMSQQFANLFNDLKTHMNFDIKVDVIFSNEYVSRYNAYKAANSSATVKDFYNHFFEEYDMIILGFEDCYEDIKNAEAVQAIDLFIDSGRSVLFSHDTTSYFNVEETAYFTAANSRKSNAWDHWGYYLNQYIRSDVGMDRFGITEDSLSALKAGSSLSSTQLDTYETAANALNKDIAYLPNKTTNNIKGSTVVEVQGFSNGVIYEYGTNTGSANIVYGDYASNNITQVNQGQITTYPYDINIDNGKSDRTASGGYQVIARDKTSVAATHSQYYQLDMDEDMVVWYCLGDNGNDAFPNDVRNSYYIYSVGNVTYTGMGHFQSTSSSTNTLGDAEAKLFVNTIVASYNSGKKTPSVNIIADSTNKAAALNYVYRTYDEELALNDTSDVVVNFHAKDMNIVNGNKTILANYYYEINQSEFNSSTGSTDVAIKDENGNNLYLRLAGTSQATGVTSMSNDSIAQFTIKGDWINAKMLAAGDNPFKVYVGVQTQITYNQADGEIEYTPQAFDYVTFKYRKLFNLD